MDIWSRYIFQIIDSDTASNQTYVDCAVTKFGIDRVFGVLVKHMPPVARVCSYSNLHPLMIAASYETNALSVIFYFVLTHHLDHACTYNKKKRKHILVSGE